MFDKIVEYAKNNLPIVLTVAAALFLIIVVLIAMSAKKSKAKKVQKSAVKTEEKQAVVTPAPVQPTPIPEKTEIKEQKAEIKSETAEVKKEEAKTPAPASPAKQPAAAKKTTPATQKTAQKPIQKPTEEKKSVTAPTTAEKKPARSSSRYTGKWVICRVVTAAHAEGNLTDEFADEMFFFELRASNGEKLLTSEEYTTQAGAVAGIETHKANIEKGNFRITLSKKGDYIFKLLNGKNMLLCMGEHYSTKLRCESAIESAKRFAKTAVIDESVQDIVIPNPTEEEEVEIKEAESGYNGKWIIRSHEQEDERVFYFELYASNGEKLLSSEEYTTYTGAVNGIETHKTNIEKDHFKVSFTKRGDYIYKLLNGNGQLLCLGEHYKTRRRCESAIESVKRFAKNAAVFADPETAAKRS